MMKSTYRAPFVRAAENTDLPVLVIARNPPRPCHCEEPVRATPVLSVAKDHNLLAGNEESRRSPRKKSGDCFAEFSLSEAEWARNDIPPDLSF